MTIPLLKWCCCLGSTIARHFDLKDTTIIKTAHRASSGMQPFVITQRVCCQHACTVNVRTNVGATQCHTKSAGKHSRPQLAARATVEQDTTSTEASRAEARRMRRETRDATDTTVDINPVSIPEQVQRHYLGAQVTSTLLFSYTWLAYRQMPI